jgi:hypothetical protein
MGGLVVYGAESFGGGDFSSKLRGEGSLNSPIDEGQTSTMPCHLGNIASRTNTVVECNPQTGRLVSNPAGKKLGKQEHRPVSGPCGCRQLGRPPSA